ncbi:hypothetical protein MRY87_08010 [bacterium]|nr:hypothetical protein [bacterium]
MQRFYQAMGSSAVLVACSLLFFTSARADGMEGAEPILQVPQQFRPVAPARSLSDQRMPPVVPGETVSAGGGRHKVISTVGPVPVQSPVGRAPRAPVPAEVPAPPPVEMPPSPVHSPSVGAPSAGAPVSVIIDRRNGGGE